MRFPLLIIALLAFTHFSKAQSFEVGANIGETGYYGDLDQSDILVEKMHLAYNIFAKYHFNERFTLRVNYMQGKLSGTDADNTKPALIARNLHFRTPLQEVAVMGEFSIFRFSDHHPAFMTPYVTAGIAGFHFNPQAQYQGEWHDLQPLSTEGQGTSTFPDREPYSLYQIAIPIGIGVKMEVTDNLIVGVEGIWRKTFTDYIDDVSRTYGDPETLRQEKGELAAALSNRSGKEVSANSQRGTAYLKDMYQFFGVSLSYRFTSGNGNANKKDLYCPVKF